MCEGVHVVFSGVRDGESGEGLPTILEAAVFSISGWWQTSPYPFAVEGRAAGMSSPDLV